MRREGEKREIEDENGIREGEKRIGNRREERNKRRREEEERREEKRKKGRIDDIGKKKDFLLSLVS
jgi:hypothetical protein